MSEVKVVVHDPRGELAEGTVVEGEVKCRLLAVRGVVALPVSLERLRHPGAVGACGAYVRRSYGRPGVACSIDRPGAVCPTAVYLTRGEHVLRAEVGVGSGYANPVDLRWVVVDGDASVRSSPDLGEGVVRAGSDGFAVLALYGMADASVEWLALTLTPA